MVRILYEYNKKDFMRLYKNRSYRSIDDNCSRILILFLTIFSGFIFLVLDKIAIYTSNGKLGYNDIYNLLMQVILILLMIISVIYLLAYIRATICWEKRQMIREKACCIRAISFDTDCMIVDCVVLNKRLIKKISYQELSVARIYKNGLFLSIKGNPPLYVCKPLFATEEEYELVCEWIKADKQSKKRSKGPS